jgi:hypothetical protein
MNEEVELRNLDVSIPLTEKVESLTFTEESIENEWWREFEDQNR